MSCKVPLLSKVCKIENIYSCTAYFVSNICKRSYLITHLVSENIMFYLALYLKL